MVRIARLSVALAALLLAAAAQAAPSPAQILAAPPATQTLQLGSTKPRDGYRYQTGHILQPDPYGEQPLRTDFELYRAETDRPAPLVLVLTPYRGVTFADTGYAEALARAGMHAAVIAVPRNAYRQDAGIDYIDRFFVRHTANVLALKQALQGHPLSPIQVSASAILGTSLGAIRASILFGVDPQLRAAVLIMPGGDLPKLIAHTVLQPIALWREQFLFPELQDEPFAIAPEATDAERLAFERRLRPHVHTDPLDFVRSNDAADVLMVRSDNDTFVPRINQDRLFEAYRSSGQQPQQIEGSGLGHYATVLAVYQEDRGRIVEFLRQRLLR